MTRLLVHVEGETEERFVNEVLAPHLYDCKFSRVSARLMGNARQRSQRGGIRSWATVRKGIMNHLCQDKEYVVTTMVDYYGMPQTGSKAWPGRFDASKLAYPKNAEAIEMAIASDVSEQMRTDFNPERFVPYVMMHEFEAVLFSDCERFAKGIEKPELAPEFQEIRDEFECPEEIDDSPESAPSKRIQSLVPRYEKVLMGTLAALEIGLETIRSECPHFHSWLKRLEVIPARLDA